MYVCIYIYIYIYIYRYTYIQAGNGHDKPLTDGTSRTAGMPCRASPAREVLQRPGCYPNCGKPKVMSPSWR